MRANSVSVDSQEMEGLMDRTLVCIHQGLPNPPVSAQGHLSALKDAGGCDGVDRISSLPDTLLGNIITRLPFKDAARTAVLARRWRPIWRSTPLVLIDTHLLPAGADEIPLHVGGADSAAVAAAVSRVLDAHPGPFRFVRLTCSYMYDDRSRLARCLQHLAVKGVQELDLINRLWRFVLDVHMPATIFSMASLTRLYLGFWRFPDTAGLPRGAAFPCLRELGLCYISIEARDIDFILARSPVLDTLYILGNCFHLQLRLVSRSLQCVKIFKSSLESVALVNVPCLERLVVSGKVNTTSSIKIGHAPALRLIGYLEPGKDTLQVGNTIIKAGTLLNPSTMVPTVKILALQLPLGVRNDAKMLISLLRCFPNVETLHILSKKTTESSGRLNLKFWQESGAIECIQSRIKVMAFHGFRSDRSELAFLKFFAEGARMLKKVVVVFAKGCLHSTAEADKVRALFSGKEANEGCTVVVYESVVPEDDGIWDYQRGSHSCRNPFAFVCSSTGVVQCFD